MIKIKNVKAKSIFVLLITVLVLGIVLKDEFPIIIETLGKSNLLWILVCLIIMVLSIFFKSLGLKEVVKGYDYRINKWKAFLIEVKTCFFNGITPFSTGGQPFQIFELKKEGIGIVKGASIELVNFVTYQIALVLLGLIVIIINSSMGIFTDKSLNNFLLTGFIINTVILGILFLFSYAKKVTKKISIFFINILSKIGIIKDKKSVLNSLDDKLDEFHRATYFYEHRRLEFFLSITCHVFELILLYMIPLFAFYALNDFTSVNFIESFVSTSFTIVMGTFVPIPGGSGGMEYVYTKLFGYFASSSITTTTLIIWRSVSYYIPMLIGGLLFNLKERK